MKYLCLLLIVCSCRVVYYEKQTPRVKDYPITDKAKKDIQKRKHTKFYAS